jgi:hypothetical protein
VRRRLPHPPLPLPPVVVRRAVVRGNDAAAVNEAAATESANGTADDPPPDAVAADRDHDRAKSAVRVVVQAAPGGMWWRLPLLPQQPPRRLPRLVSHRSHHSPATLCLHSSINWLPTRPSSPRSKLCSRARRTHKDRTPAARASACARPSRPDPHASMSDRSRMKSRTHKSGSCSPSLDPLYVAHTLNSTQQGSRSCPSLHTACAHRRFSCL